MASPAALAPPLDNEDLLSLILVRLPPLPSSFSSVSLVCKRWHRLVRDPGFLSRLRAFHRTPPVLGFFHNSPDSARFVAIQGISGIRMASAVRDLRRDGAGGMWWFVDCRHGRSLLRSRDWADLLVWDPINGRCSLIIVPYQFRARASDLNAAVLCPSGAPGCGSIFSAVVVFTIGHNAFACVYSSQTRAWGDLVSIPMPSLESELTEEPGALVGDAMYWLLGESSILEFQLGDQRFALVERPLETFSVYKRNIRVVKSDRGVLGLAAVKNFSLHLWAWEADHCGSAKWVLHRAIELRTLLELPLTQPRVGSIPVWISGLCEDSGAVFLRTMVGMFVVWPETMQFKMVTNNVLMKTVYPYAKFHFPGECGFTCLVEVMASGSSEYSTADQETRQKMLSSEVLIDAESTTFCAQQEFLSCRQRFKCLIHFMEYTISWFADSTVKHADSTLGRHRRILRQTLAIEK